MQCGKRKVGNNSGNAFSLSLFGLFHIFFLQLLPCSVLNTHKQVLGSAPKCLSVISANFVSQPSLIWEHPAIISTSAPGRSYVHCPARADNSGLAPVLTLLNSAVGCDCEKSLISEHKF